jgi:hypothetical protein
MATSGAVPPLATTKTNRPAPQNGQQSLHNIGQGEEKSRAKSVTRTGEGIAGICENLVDPFEIYGASRIKREENQPAHRNKR